MKIISTLMTLIAVMALAAPATTMAAAKKKTAETGKTDAEKPGEKKAEDKGDKKKDHYPLMGKVVSISDTELVIKGGKDKPDRKFIINKDTAIKKDDKPATAKDATVGQDVTGYVKKAADGKGEPSLVSLNLSPKKKDKGEGDKGSAKKTEGDKPGAKKKKSGS